jgi:hypothetical protein
MIGLDFGRRGKDHDLTPSVDTVVRGPTRRAMHSGLAA